MKILSILLGALMLATNAVASDLTEIQDATTRLNTYQKDTLVGLCSAEFIAPDMVITAAHCAMNADNFTVGFPVKEYPLVPVEINADSDIMILYSPEYKSEHYVTISPTFPKSSLEEVVAVCYFGEENTQRLMMGLITGEGLVQLEESSDKTKSTIIRSIGTTIHIEEGCSGGGLYREISPNNYGLISVASGYDNEGSYFTYPDYLYAALALTQDKM